MPGANRSWKKQISAPPILYRSSAGFGTAATARRFPEVRRFAPCGLSRAARFEAAKGRLAESNAVQGEIWNRAVAATKAAEVNGNAVTSLVLSSLNDMIDITTTRTVALQTHPPLVIFWMLILMVLAGALLAGYGTADSKQRSWLHTVGFAVLMTVAIYIIIDLEYPRFGLIRVDAVD